MAGRVASTLFMCSFATIGTTFGVAVSQATNFTVPTHQIDAGWTMSVGTVLSVMAVVLPAAWWLSGKFQMIADYQKLEREHREAMAHSIRELDRKVNTVFTKLTDVPCYRNGGVCILQAGEEADKKKD